MSEAAASGRPTYRAYHMNEHGGIARADVIEAASDSEALDRVHGMKARHAIELWDRARFIRTISPSRPADVT